MYKQQKKLNINNNGEVNIQIPNIYDLKIMDKCVVDNLAKEINKDILVLNEGNRECINSINKSFSNISKSIINLNNSIKNIENILKTSTNNTDSVYEEVFVDATNIDMSSTCDIDFKNNCCMLPRISCNNIEIDDIYVDGKKRKELLDTFENNGISLSIQENKSSEIEIIFSDYKCINELAIDFLSDYPILYELYSVNNDIYTLLDTKNITNNTVSSFSKIDTKKIVVKLTAKNENINISINSIITNFIIYKNEGRLLTKEIRVNCASEDLIVNADTNYSSNVKSYIGLITKSGDIKWYNGDEKLRIGISNSIKKTANSRLPVFNQEYLNFKKIYNLGDNYNAKSIKVYSGFGMWHRTKILKAFMNENLTVIEYTKKDIVSSEYVDIEHYKDIIKSGELIILSQTVHCDKEIEITIPKITCTQHGEADKTKLFRYSLNINGEIVSSFDNISSSYTHTLKKGNNEIQILLNLKKEKDDDNFEVKYTNTINFKEYSDMIYHKKLSLSSIAGLYNDNDNERFSVAENSIIVNSLNGEENFLVKYETLVDSDVHYNDYTGQYLKVKVMFAIYTDNCYNNVVINKFSIKR